MNEQPKKVHLRPLLHLLCMIALAIWWGGYFWGESPSRWLLQHYVTAEARAPRSQPAAFLLPNFGDRAHNLSQRLTLAARAGLGDIACGLGVLSLLGLGSGVYVRRLDTWLGARASGHAVAFRGQNLTADALDANKEEQKGILR